MNLNQNYYLLQIVEKILNSASQYDEYMYCTDESLIFSFDRDDMKDLVNIRKELQNKCKKGGLI